MSWFGTSDKSIALSFLVLSTPNFTQFICHSFTLNLLFTHLTMISFTSTSRSFSDTRFSSLFILSIFIHHVLALPIFNSDQRSWSTSTTKSFLYQSRIHTLFFNMFFYRINIFIFLIGSSVSLKSMLFSEYILLSSNFIVGLLNIFIN